MNIVLHFVTSFLMICNGISFTPLFNAFPQYHRHYCKFSFFSKNTLSRRSSKSFFTYKP